MTRRRVAVVTNFPSHYQVDLFNAIADLGEIDLHVFYLRTMTPGRQWTTLREIRHQRTFVAEFPGQRWVKTLYLNPGLLLHVRRFSPHQCVITQYGSIAMVQLMCARILTRKPWIFWSESPGVRYSEHLPPWTGVWRTPLRRLVMLLLRGATQIWGIGQTAVLQYELYTGRRCRNVPYFFDQAQFRAIERQRVPASLTFLFSGKLLRRKGFDLLIEAVERLASQGLEFGVLVVGDGPERWRLRQASQRAQDRMRCLGFLQLPEMAAAYSECDVLVCPSRHDGWGMVVAEAMAAGMPVISTAQTGAAVDMVRDGENGFLLPEPDAIQLAHAMRILIEDPMSIAAMGLRAREQAACYTAANGAQVFSAALSDALR